MRTTLSLSDDVLLRARRYARTESISLGEAISRLAMMGLQMAAEPAPQTGPQPDDTLPASGRFPDEQGSTLLTAEEVRRLIDENGPY